MTDRIAIEADHVRKAFGATVAVDDVSFQVELGSVHALLGENGAGKSTIVKLLSGLKQVGPKTYTWCHWLFDLEKGDCVATSEAVAIALDLETRKAIPIPDEMREKLETLVVAGLGV